MKTVIRQLFDAEPASPLYVAINRVLVGNDPDLMGMMKQASAKMCLATALTPGFKGFDLMKQLGVCPMGMRWGARPDMGDQLSHIWIDQFTYWESWEAHEDFHETFEDVVVDTCAKCGDILLEGPEEPIYRIVHSDLPKLISMNQWLRRSVAGESEGYAVDSGQSVTVMATHRVRPGGEEAFEAGEVATLDMLKESTGMLGYQILKRIGISTLGSGHATVESLSKKLKAMPGSKLERTADVWEGYTIPSEYLVMVEWESLGDARGGMPHVNVKPELLRIHGPKVLDNCLQVPAVRMADSMFREQTYREILSQSQR